MIKTENLTILFVDIAGFTATTSRQSRAENARLLQNFGSTLLPLIKNYKGRLIKTIGDALLITFRSPTDAMLCSMALQDAMHGYNLSAPEGEKIHIRVAANLGEVRVTKNDIFGEPVNVASRIEGVAPADEIYLSEAVYMAMNKAEVPAMEVGSKELAGVPHPVRLYNIPRFSTHRLISVRAGNEEQGSELLYPYGGMHYQVRSRSFANLLSMQGRKNVTRLLIQGFAVCVIAFIAVLGYQYYKKSVSGPAVTSQSAKDETRPAGTVEIEQGKTEEPVSAKPEVQVAAVAEKTGTPLEDVSEKDVQKLSAAQGKATQAGGSQPSPAGTETIKQATQKTGEAKTASKAVDSGVAKTVSGLKKEYTSSTWTPEPEKSTGSTWTPEPAAVKERSTVSTWAPEPEAVKEKSTVSTWTPEPEDVKEKPAVSTRTPVNNIVSTPVKEPIPERTETDLTETESDEGEGGADDVISAPITYAAKEAITDWNVTKAKQAFNSSEISKIEYNRILGKLKTEYDKKIRQLKLDLNRGEITRAEYDQAVRNAKLDYSGR